MMTAGLAMAIRKKRILPGALVMVSFPIENEQEFTVRERYLATPTSKPQYTLYGCNGPNDKPYWFLEDELIVIQEVDSCH